MELREYWEILKRGRKTFWSVFGFCLLIGALAVIFYPRTFEAYLPLDIGRLQQQETGDFRYDGYYQLLADEKIADTVAKWALSKEMKLKIIEGTKIGKQQEAKLKIKAEKVAANYLRIRISYPEKLVLEKGTEIVKVTLLERLSKIEGQTANQSVIFFGEKIIEQKKIPFGLIGLAVGIFGVFFGVVAVLLKKYFKADNQ